MAAVLADQESPTGGFIRETIDDLRMSRLVAAVDDVAAELLARRFEEKISITQPVGISFD